MERGRAEPSTQETGRQLGEELSFIHTEVDIYRTCVVL